MNFLLDEFSIAIHQMEPNKALGPDGFNPGFYHRFWEKNGEEIFHACSGWLERSYFPASLNDTNIALLPKVGNPTNMTELRPIALCNVLYKLISKVLANRLKKVLPSCISEEQSAFVARRSILDNTMMAIEVLHAMKTRRSGKKGDMAVKIDISKAYDRVDWGFLHHMMISMGFAPQWVDWIMLCVTSVNYSVLLNQDPVGPILPGRGLHQGDPLSPYLFILVAEGLTALIHRAVTTGELHGVQICRNAPILTHLLFANDCFLFFRATHGEVTIMQRILNTYEAASGQAINFAKSEVSFSSNVSQDDRQRLASVLGVQLSMGVGKYLGVASMVG